MSIVVYWNILKKNITNSVFIEFKQETSQTLIKLLFCTAIINLSSQVQSTMLVSTLSLFFFIWNQYFINIIQLDEKIFLNYFFEMAGPNSIASHLLLCNWHINGFPFSKEVKNRMKFEVLSNLACGIILPPNSKSAIFSSAIKS